MGVPGFNSWFAGNHRHAYVSRLNRSWDHVYIDMASILHAAMKKCMQLLHILTASHHGWTACADNIQVSAAYNLPHFHKVLFARLDSIMALASPRKSVMFALDGPAPLAKLLTQRCGSIPPVGHVLKQTPNWCLPYPHFVKPNHDSTWNSYQTVWCLSVMSSKP